MNRKEHEMKPIFQRFFSICLSFTTAMTCAPRTVFAEEWQTESETFIVEKYKKPTEEFFEVDGIKYRVIKDVDGNQLGEVSVDVQRYKNIKEVVIPKQVTNSSKTYSVIGFEFAAFSNCSNLTKIDLSQCSELTMIGSYAFADCTELVEIDLSNCSKLTEIRNNAFSGCKSLKLVVLPEGLTTIEHDAFDLGTGAAIQEINIPSTVKQIDSNFLSGTTNQTKLVFQGQERPTMNGLAFQKITGNNKPSVYFPATLKAINSYVDVNSLFVKDGFVGNVQVCPKQSINISYDANVYENLINTNLNVAKLDNKKIRGLKEGNTKIATSLNIVVNRVESEYVNNAWNVEVGHLWKKTVNSNIWKCTLCNATYEGVVSPTGGSGGGSTGGSTSGGSGGGSSTGGGSTIDPNAPTPQVENAVYRAYNSSNGEHLYTTNYEEFKVITKNGWDDEGIAFMSESKEKGQAVYRVYNPNSGLHHYTTNVNEKNTLVSLGWNDEGVAFYTSKNPKDTPVYRVYNENDGNHHYTMNANEALALISMGWKNEGIAFLTAPMK